MESIFKSQSLLITVQIQFKLTALDTMHLLLAWRAQFIQWGILVRALSEAGLSLQAFAGAAKQTCEDARKDLYRLSNDYNPQCLLYS